MLKGQIKLDSNGNVGLGTTSFFSETGITAKYNTSGSTPTVISAKYTGATDVTARAVEGIASQGSSYGTGGYFKGAEKGVYGESTATGGFIHYGVYGRAKNGYNNYGVYGTSSGYAGYFDGDVTVTGNFSSSSDKKLKESIERLPSQTVLDKIVQLQPKSFIYKYSEYDQMNLPSGKQYGLIAQDVKEIFPSLISTQSHPKKGTATSQEEAVMEYKTLKYNQLVPLLIQALKEQQKQINELKEQINELKEQIN